MFDLRRRDLQNIINNNFLKTYAAILFASAEKLIWMTRFCWSITYGPDVLTHPGSEYELRRKLEFLAK